MKHAAQETAVCCLVHVQTGCAVSISVTCAQCAMSFHVVVECQLDNTSQGGTKDVACT